MGCNEGNAGQRLASPARRSHSTQRQPLVVRAEKGKREPWDFGRFLSTVSFFNPPDALLRSVFKGLMGQQQADASVGSSAIVTLIPAAQRAGDQSPRAVVMVTGATGGVGRRVVARLLSRGAHVRALVRDVAKGRQMLAGLQAGPGASLELVPADITQRPTLLPEYFAGVRQLICCTAAKVQPKGDTDADRKKYYQGIKFYDPEVVGDTPEAVEWRGMQNLLDAAKQHLGSAAGKALWLPDGSGALPAWGVLDDVVMGGASQSAFVVRQGAGEGGGPAGVFAGTVTTANNGGFASVRTRDADPPLDLGAYDGLELRVRGDGLRYKLILRCSAGWDTAGYTASFNTTPGWQTVRVRFQDMKPVFRARTMRNMPPLNPATIYSLQLMLSKFEADGELNPTFKPGRFELPVERIGAYMAEPPAPRFVLVSSAGVTRPGRPGTDVETEPPAVELNDELGGLLTYKLRAEDEVQASGVPFAIVRPVALTEGPGGMPLVVEQGDTLRGKVSREDVAELCVALLDQPDAVNTILKWAPRCPSASHGKLTLPSVRRLAIGPDSWGLRV